MKACEEILQKCTECFACVNECPFLLGLGKTPRNISEEVLGGMDLTKSYVFSCFLCGLCKVVCPKRLDVPQMFLEAREVLTLDMLSLCSYVKLLLSDESNSLINIYKNRKVSYHETQTPKFFRYAFLPGCSMIYFSPKAISKTYAVLSRVLGDVGILDVCCGKPVYDFGLKERAVKWLNNSVLKELIKHGCNTVITACPNCYYYLKRMLPRDFNVTTIYEELKGELLGRIEGLRVTIHDSCPDRFDGVFANEVRNTLAPCNIVEMMHSMNKTLCCGAGGLVAYTNPQLSQFLANIRIQEMLEVRADVLVTYCYTCVGMFSRLQPPVKVKHALDLLLGVEESYVERQEELLKIISELMNRINI
ncbi:MAG: (Fe-S)-binding protein [Candidatus Nezhaarchaeales archaeon]